MAFVCARKGKDIHRVALDQAWLLISRSDKCTARFHEGVIMPLKAIYTKSPSRNWVTTSSFMRLGSDLRVLLEAEERMPMCNAKTN